MITDACGAARSQEMFWLRCFIVTWFFAVNTDVFGDSLTSKHFLIHTDRRTWNEAQALCEDSGGRLAMIDNKATHDALVAFSINNDTSWNAAITSVFWIGLNKNRSSTTEFRWDHCEPINSSFACWEENEPKNPSNSHCVYALRTNLKWKVESCNNEAQYLCEKDTGPCWYKKAFGNCPSAAHQGVYDGLTETECEEKCSTCVHDDLACWMYSHEQNICNLYFDSNPEICSSSSLSLNEPSNAGIRICFTYEFVTSQSSIVIDDAVPLIKCNTGTTTISVTTMDVTTYGKTETNTHSTPDTTTDINNSTSTNSNTDPSAYTDTSTTTNAITDPSAYTDTSTTTNAITDPSAYTETSTTTNAITDPSAYTETSTSTNSNTDPSAYTETSTTTNAITDPSAYTDTSTTTKSVMDPTTYTDTSNTDTMIPNTTSLDSMISTTISKSVTSTSTFILTTARISYTSTTPTHIMMNNTVYPSTTTQTSSASVSTQNAPPVQMSTTNQDNPTNETMNSISTNPQETTFKGVTSTATTTESPNVSPGQSSSTIATMAFGNSCYCMQCVVAKNSTEIQTLVDSLLIWIKVDPTKLSATRRKRESAYDHRRSAQALGYSGILIIIISLSVFIIIDIIRVCQFVVDGERK